jgi:hypothetical protein
MSVNKSLPHVLVLPEDDANRQVANGFYLDPLLDTRRMQILGEAGGWREVLNLFAADHVPEMERYSNRFMVLLIDFDGREDRRETISAAIPDHLRERVFVLGTRSEPEELRRNLGRSYESIGLEMAKDCRDGTQETWAHDLLSHNASELERLREFIRPILFRGN